MGMPMKVAFIDTDNEDDDSFSWYNATINKVIKRGKRYVLCSIKYDDAETSRVRFYDDDYWPEGTACAEKWKFGTTSMNLLVQELRAERDKTHELKLLLSCYQENNAEKQKGHDVFYNEDDDPDSDDDDEDDEDYQEESEEAYDSSDEDEANDSDEDNDDNWENEKPSPVFYSCSKHTVYALLFALFFAKVVGTLNPQIDLLVKFFSRAVKTN